MSILLEKTGNDDHGIRDEPGGVEVADLGGSRWRRGVAIPAVGYLIEAVISDVSMPGIGGLELLRHTSGLSRKVHQSSVPTAWVKAIPQPLRREVKAPFLYRLSFYITPPQRRIGLASVSGAPAGGRQGTLTRTDS